MSETFSLNDFENLITRLPSRTINLKGYVLHKLLKPLELGYSAGGFLRRADAICPTRFMFLLPEQERSIREDEDDLEISQEICWNYLWENAKTIFTGISDSCGPMSFSQSLGLIDLGGNYIYFLNTPDDMAPRFCSYFRKADYPGNMKTIIKEIFFSQGKVIDDEYPIFENGLWGTNEFHSFFNEKFCRELICDVLERTNSWSMEKDMLVDHLMWSDASTEDYIGHKLEHLRSFAEGVLNSDCKVVSDTFDDEPSEQEKQFLVEGIFHNRVEIFEEHRTKISISL